MIGPSQFRPRGRERWIEDYRLLKKRPCHLILAHTLLACVPQPTLIRLPRNEALWRLTQDAALLSVFHGGRNSLRHRSRNLVLNYEYSREFTIIAGRP